MAKFYKRENLCNFPNFNFYSLHGMQISRNERKKRKNSQRVGYCNRLQLSFKYLKWHRQPTKYIPDP